MGALAGIRWIDLPTAKDPRGLLTSVEGGQDLPFEIRRIFYMHQIVADRGGHAHIDTDQVVIAISGQFRMTLADGEQTETHELNSPVRGLYIPRLIFTNLLDFSPGAVGLVLCSTHYDRTRSLRSWDAYQAHRQQTSSRE